MGFLSLFSGLVSLFNKLVGIFERKQIKDEGKREQALESIQEAEKDENVAKKAADDFVRDIDAGRVPVKQPDRFKRGTK